MYVPSVVFEKLAWVAIGYGTEEWAPMHNLILEKYKICDLRTCFLIIIVLYKRMYFYFKNHFRQISKNACKAYGNFFLAKGI